MWSMTNKEKREEKKLNAIFKLKYGRKKKKNKKKFKSISPELWRKRVLMRDDYSCKYCGSRTNLQVHHKKLKSEHPEAACKVKNGLTLCRDCHNNEHQGLIDYYRDQKFLRDIVSEH